MTPDWNNLWNPESIGGGKSVVAVRQCRAFNLLLPSLCSLLWEVAWTWKILHRKGLILGILTPPRSSASFIDAVWVLILDWKVPFSWLPLPSPLMSEALIFNQSCQRDTGNRFNLTFLEDLVWFPTLLQSRSWLHIRAKIRPRFFQHFPNICQAFAS